MVRYSPTRIGFLVRKDCIDDLVRAAELNTILWGGIFNPLIPVCPDTNSVDDELVGAFQLDALCPVASIPRVETIPLCHPLLNLQGESRESVLVHDSSTRRSTPTLLDINDVTHLYWDRNFKHTSSDFRSHYALVQWPEEDPLAPLFALAFGQLSSGLRFSVDYGRLFVQGLRARTLRIASSKPLPATLTRYLSPLATTTAELKKYGSSQDGGGVFVGDGNRFEDLLNFWNIRAAGHPVRFLDINRKERFESFIARHLEVLDTMASSSIGATEHISFYCRTADCDQTQRIAESFATRKTVFTHPLESRYLPSIPTGSTRLEFGYEFVSSTVEESGAGYTLHVGLPEKKFLPDVEAARFKTFSVTIEPVSEIRYSGHTLRPPAIRPLRELFCQRMLRYASKPQIRGREYRHLVRGIDHRSLVDAISHDGIIAALFGKAGYVSELSTAGLLAKRIVEKMGSLERTRLFKIRGVRELIKSVGPSDAFAKGLATKRLWNDGQFEEHKELSVEPNGTLVGTTDQVFRLLVREGFLRSGLSLRCSHCYLKDWRALRELDDVWQCRFCRTNNSASPELMSDAAWKFRKSGLLAKDNNQEGAIPVILTIAVLDELFGRESFVWSFALNLTKGQTKCEVDLCVIVDGADDEVGGPEIAIGECKSEGGVIDAADVEHLASVARDLRQLDIAPYLVFTKTGAKFARDELERFRAIREEGLECVLMTNRELEPRYPYGGGDEDGCVEWPRSMRALADNSRRRYLD